MSDDPFITLREIELREENLTLKFAQMVGETIDIKFREWEERWEIAGDEKFHKHVLELTGETSDNSDRIRAGNQWAMKGAESEANIKGKFRGALIGFSLPSAAAVIAWIMDHWPKGN